MFRETICSSPSRTHDSQSVSDDEISFDMEHFNQELESLKHTNQSSQNKGEKLVSMVTNILVTILWSGKGTRKQRKVIVNTLYTNQGHVVASINMLALNNKLYLSHSLLKRRLTVQAVLSDIKDKSQVTAEQSQLARQMKESVYGFGQEWDYFINKKNVMKKPRLLNIDVIERLVN